MALRDNYPRYVVTDVVNHRPRNRFPTEFLVKYEDEENYRWEESWHFVSYDDKGDDPIYTTAFYKYCRKNKIPLSTVTPTREELQRCFYREYHHQK